MINLLYKWRHIPTGRTGLRVGRFHNYGHTLYLFSYWSNDEWSYSPERVGNHDLDGVAVADYTGSGQEEPHSCLLTLAQIAALNPMTLPGGLRDEIHNLQVSRQAVPG